MAEKDNNNSNKKTPNNNNGLMLLSAMFIALALVLTNIVPDVSVLDPSQEVETTSPDLLNYFNAQEISTRTPILSVKPTWGKSRLLDEWNISPTASINESGGRLSFNTSTDPNAHAFLRTKERGDYESGSIGETGMGIRIPEKAVGNQYAEWGYFDELNGIGWGHNSNCELYSFVKRNGDKNTTCLTNNSNADLEESYDVSNGYIYTSRFVWYGEGPINWYISDYDNSKPKGENLVYTEQFKKQITLVDPNQPINVKVRNNGTADNFQLLLGGRQMGTYNGRAQNDQTPVIQQMDDYTLTEGENVWEPVMSMRAKEFYGESQRPNSVRIAFKGLSVTCTQNCRYRVTADATTANESNWRGVTWTGESSAAEVKTATNTTINIVDRGVPIMGGEVPVSKSADTRAVREDEDLVLGTDDEVILWVLQDDNNAPVVDATLKWNEQR